MGTSSLHILVFGALWDVRWLREQAMEVDQVEQIPEGFEWLQRKPYDVALFNFAISDGAGMEFLAKARTLAPQVPIVVLARAQDEELALTALHLGAEDYFLINEPDKLGLIGVMRRAVERHKAGEVARRDQHLLDTLMNKLPDAIYFKDGQSRFVRISRALARRFSLPDPALAIGKTDTDFFKGAHAHQALIDEQRIISSGSPMVGIEEMETWQDGSISWVSTTKMPLRDAAGRIIGTFGISRDLTSRKEAELVLAERTRQLRHKNQQMEEELKMAHELQLAMLPHSFPGRSANGAKGNSIEFFSFYSPSGTVSGDFFDIVELSDTAVGLFICDVMGHDVRAALVTAMVRALVRDLSAAAAEPGELLTQINRGLTGVFRQTGATMFATAFYLIADLARREMRYSSAAHPDALHLSRNEGSVNVLNTSGKRKGPALGLFEETVFPTCRRPLAAGDLILLFTDGLTEAEGPTQECFTIERLAASVRRHAQLPANDLVRQTIDDVRQFCGGAELGDDASLLGMEVKRLEPATT
jgi:sigma-B regulation protein RsbU (phosphoserine phosphatase)